MPRAPRYYLPGHVWHLPNRCHEREFLLKFGRDRNRWGSWLFAARKRCGLSVLNYMGTSNHVPLLVFSGDGRQVIPRAMQPLAGRTGELAPYMGNFDPENGVPSAKNVLFWKLTN